MWTKLSLNHFITISTPIRNLQLVKSVGNMIDIYLPAASFVVDTLADTGGP